MVKAKIGAQGFTVKQQFKDLGPYETMKRIADIGYHAIEISQVDMTAENVAEIKRASEDFKIEIASLSAGLKPNFPGQESLTTDYDKIVQDCRTLNCDLLRIGMLPRESMESLETVLEFCNDVNEVTKRLKEDGITLYYHNHHIEFAKYDGEYMLDIIRKNAPLLGFELDVHWIHRGGADPVKVIKDYKGKVELIHLKDYRISPLPKEAMDAYRNGDNATFGKYFQNLVQFGELGTGSLDFKAIIEQSIDSGARYLLVEQDDTYGRDPFESLKESLDYLVELGYGHLI
ncbi:sugar phosphate isomerase/epimerase family protein [Fundicoccus culcitae]|uniref:Sugar phosphate isomerase/epimerase n=1 Tax=Fundicoccus culcitae TaxID=2969821 RepID=A0ABY5P6W1_9LACT|nr:sugar phosphate isomerase/epimerase [Fundicoccus culcitae]UUX34414.1 sugar phosphate isomerase/epimerase [Fundicoccus culcitae]